MFVFSLCVSLCVFVGLWCCVVLFVVLWLCGVLFFVFCLVIYIGSGSFIPFLFVSGVVFCVVVFV